MSSREHRETPDRAAAIDRRLRTPHVDRAAKRAPVVCHPALVAIYACSRPLVMIASGDITPRRAASQEPCTARPESSTATRDEPRRQVAQPVRRPRGSRRMKRSSCSPRRCRISTPAKCARWRRRRLRLDKARITPKKQMKAIASPSVIGLLRENKRVSTGAESASIAS